MPRSARGLLLALAATAVGTLPAGSSVRAAPEAAPRPPSGAELAALARPPARGSLAAQRIYFVLPDRYANGDPSNDRAGLTGGRDATGFDPASPAYYHGGDLRGLTGECADERRGLARLKALGFTAVWVTPPVRQRYVQAGSAGYHGYWGLDFTTVDPHLGTDADFAAFVACAHGLGLKVYLDVVVNHTADVISPSGGVRYVSPRERPYRDCRGRRFDPARYVGRSTFPCLRAATMPRPPVVAPSERAIKRPAWLNDVTRYHNRGDVDFDSCDQTCYELGDFFGLDDLFTEQQAVVDGLAAMHGEWIRRFKVDGFRLDTARHVNRSFFRLWAPKVRAIARQAGVADFELFGEVLVTDAAELSAFVRERGLPTVLDFPLQDALARFAGGSAGPRGVAARLADDDLFSTAAGVAHTPPTFLGNHDIGRAALKVREQTDADTRPQLLARLLLGYGALYLLRGAPVVYYGDEVGIVGRGGDQQARHDLFPTQVREWQTEERVGSGAIGTGSSFEIEGHPIAERLRVLGALRDAHPALSTGATVVRLAQGTTLAVSRIDAAARREYLVLLNNGVRAARVTVATSSPSVSWAPLLGTSARPRSGADGRVTVEVPAVGAVLLRAESVLPPRHPGRPVLQLGREEALRAWEVRARLGAGPASVAFAVRRAGGRRWVRLGVDDSPPYRAFLDPARFRRGERVHLVAVARGLDDRIAVSRVTPFTVRR